MIAIRGPTGHEIATFLATLKATGRHWRVS
jgi:hypothetical protein